MQKPQFLTTGQIVFRIISIILLTEFLIMILLGSNDFSENRFVVAAIDVLLLALIATPSIYFWVVMPFVTDRESAYEEVSQQAMTDSLTQLANRRHLDYVLEIEYNRHERSGTELAIIMLDIDEFKKFNDTYGHLAGDQCLRDIASALLSIVSRPADFVARYGGEEFVCVLPETGIEGALVIADKIRREIEELKIIHDSSMVSDFITVSLGIVTSGSRKVDSALGLIQQADNFLYLAKEKGRNRIAFDITQRDIDVDTHFVKLVWKKAYSSGNGLIDTQHQQLFNMTDIVLDALLADHADTEVENLIDNLVEAVHRHFNDELNILTDLGFKNTKEHAIEHQRLIDKAHVLVRNYHSGHATIGEIFQYLAYDVIANHILHDDREYFHFTRRDNLENKEIQSDKDSDRSVSVG